MTQGAPSHSAAPLGFVCHPFLGLPGGLAYNEKMFPNLVLPVPRAAIEAAAPVLLERAIVWLNHVLAAEPAATRRLQAHVGRLIELDLPGQSAPDAQGLPRLVFRITLAGLVEQVKDEAPPPPIDLRVQPAGPALRSALGWITGDRPALRVEGDAALATDINWLAANLRWDVAGDLARMFGPSAAHEIERAVSLTVATAREALGLVADLGRGGGAGSAAR
jgi:ubiquinone biosynthesis protein UbiJ